MPARSCLVDRDDVIEDKDFSIYRAILSFDPTRNTKFSTYLGNDTKWKCYNMFNRAKKYAPLEYAHLDIDEMKQDKRFVDEAFETTLKTRETFQQIHKIYDFALEQPDKRVALIVELRYKIGQGNTTMPWKKVAEKVGISIQGCINIHNKFLKEVKKNLRKICL